MKPLSYLIIRLLLGTSLFFHGLVRLPKLSAFAEGVTAEFESTLLPEMLALPFAYFIPIGEFMGGLLLILGFRTSKIALFVAFFMILLTIGTCFQENWGALPSQFLHVILAVILYEFYERTEQKFSLKN